MSIRTNFSNAFETTLTAEMGPTDLEAQVVGTGGGPTSPAYLVIDPDDPAKREYILFDGSFGTTTFRTTSTNNRYLSDSAAASGITHAEGAVVRMAATRQHFDDLHSRVDTRLATNAHTKSAHTSLGLAENPHGNEAHTQQFATAADAVPAGVIVGWSGTTSNVPSGWALCNGANGTPDLRDRFIVGAGGGYNPGDVGGVDAVTLTNSQIPAHAHTANSGSAGDHAHTSGNLAGGSHTHGAGNYSAASHSHGSGNLTGGSHTHGSGNLNTSNTGAHSHNVTFVDWRSAMQSGNSSVRDFTSANIATSNTGDHSHNITGNTSGSGVGVSGNTNAVTPTVNGNSAGSTVGVSGNTSTTGAHTHTVSVGNTGGGSSHENRPPFYALAFIMKL